MVEKGSRNGPISIIKYLGDNGPASYEKISEDLGMKKGTVESAIRNVLIKKHGLVKKHPKDKWALKWYADEEETANILKMKLLRNPQPEELAGIIKRSAADARELLVKYIPGYREPTDYEINSSAEALWMRIVACLDLPNKKYWFEHEVTNVSVDGIDEKTLYKIISDKSAAVVDEAINYLREFPDMEPSVAIEEEGNLARIKVEWSDDAKRTLYPIDFWKQTLEIKIPRKYNDMSCIGGSSPWERIEIAELLAEIYVPTPKIIDSLIELVGLPHYEVQVLIVLKKFCENALEVDQLDEKTKKMIVLYLLNVAFVMDISKHERHYERPSDDLKERNKAFEIIELLDVRCAVVIDTAKEYIISSLHDDPMDYKFVGPDIHNLAQWLAKDLKLRLELIDKIEEILKDADTIEKVRFYKDLLVQLAHQMPNCGMCAR